MENRDTNGDLHEHMLTKIASAGQNRQFRTPRHIIQPVVDMTAPQPTTRSAIRRTVPLDSSSRRANTCVSTIRTHRRHQGSFGLAS